MKNTTAWAVQRLRDIEMVNGPIKKFKSDKELNAAIQRERKKLANARAANFVLGKDDPTAKQMTYEYKKAKQKRKSKQSGKAASDKKRYPNQK